MSKKKSPEQIIIDSWEGSRTHNRTFKNWSDDTFIGYATGITSLDNLQSDLNINGWEALIRKLLSENKI